SPAPSPAASRWPPGGASWSTTAHGGERRATALSLAREGSRRWVATGDAWGQHTPDATGGRLGKVSRTRPWQGRKRDTSILVSSRGNSLSPGVYGLVGAPPRAFRRRGRLASPGRRTRGTAARAPT